MAQPSSPSQFFEIQDIVKTEFELQDAYLEEGVATFLVPIAPGLEGKIGNLRTKLKQRGFEISVRQTETGLKLLAFPATIMQAQPKRGGINYPLILFLATIVSVAASGYLTASTYTDILLTLGKIRPADQAATLWGQTILYTVAIMCIVGLHELGHTIACRINHVEASFPIFIPGIPGITLGTFGAVMVQKEPALNRNQLFEIGFSGPFVGFIVSVVVSYFGYTMSLPVSSSELARVGGAASGALELPLMFRFLSPYLFPRASNVAIYFLHPLAIAGWMGTLITFLNIFPIGQLDGGHLSRAILGPKWHRALSFGATLAMVVIGWWSMALLAMLFIGFNHPGALDDVSPVSRNKKILALLAIAMFIACLTMSPDNLLSF